MSRAAQFEHSIHTLPPDERVAIVKPKLKEIAQENEWIEITNSLEKEKAKSKKIKFKEINPGKEKRIVYYDKDNKLYYSVDTQHGRFEKCDANGNHLGEVNIDLEDIPNSRDKSGRHDIHFK